jgi:HEAT repeat protein
LPAGASIATVAAGAMIAQQVAGKAARDALFLSTFHVKALPAMMAASAVVSLVAVIWLSSMMVKYAPARVVPAVLGSSSAALLIEWAVSFTAPRLAAVAFYLHTGVFGAVTISAFWSLINELFDPHAGKRAAASVAMGGTVGGILGGIVALRASELIAVPTMLPLLAAMNVVCLWGTLRLRRAIAMPAVSEEPPRGRTLGPTSAPAAQRDDTSMLSRSLGLGPLHVLRAVPYLRNLAWVVAFGAVTSGLLDYVFSAEAVNRYHSGPALLSFFALFWLVVGILSFILQTLFGRLALEKLGLAVTLALLPGIVVLGGGIGLAVPGLWSAAILRGGEATQRNSLFRAAYELLYTPLSEQKRRSTKTLIDVGFDRFGTIAASGIAIATLAITRTRAEMVLLVVAVTCAVISLARSRLLHQGYVSLLQESLRDRAENAASDVPAVSPSADGAPRSATPPSADVPSPRSATPPSAGVPSASERGRGDRESTVVRDKIVEQLGALPSAEEIAAVVRHDAVLVPRAVEVKKRGTGEEVKSLDEAFRAAVEMRSGDAARVRRALSSETPLPATIASLAICLLADAEFHVDAIRALRKSAPKMTGQLVDALSDPTQDFDVRRRIPRVLSECTTQSAADGLLRGAEDQRFEVRYACGRALLKMVSAKVGVVVALERVVALVQGEVQRNREVWESEETSAVEDDEREAPSLFVRLLRDRVDRSLEHVFNVLALHLDPDSLQIAFKALHQEDPALWGTALEYLENVLPDGVRDAVWPFLGEERPLRSARPTNEILADLVRARQAVSPLGLGTRTGES